MLPINAISYTDSAVLSRSGFAVLYVVGFMDQTDGDPFKVGFASDLNKRLNALQTTHFRTLGISELFFVQDRQGEIIDRKVEDLIHLDELHRYEEVLPETALVPVRELERAVHRKLDADGLRVNGEWFTGGSTRIVETVKDVIKSEFGCEYHSCRSMMRKLRMWKIEADEMAAKSAIRPADNRSQTFLRGVVDRMGIEARKRGPSKSVLY